MVEDQLVESVTENEPRPAPEVPTLEDPSGHEQDQEAAESSQDRAPNGQFKRGGGWQRKIAKESRRADAALAQANYWKARAIADGHGQLSDDMTSEEWADVRQAQVRSGIPDSLRTKAEEIEEPEEPAAEGPDEKAPAEAEGESPDAPYELSPEDVQHFERHDSFIQRAGAKLVTDAEFSKAAEAVRKSGAPVEVVNFVGHVLADLPNGDEVFKALGKNPAMLLTMARLPPSHTGAILEQISSELSSSDGKGEVGRSVEPPPKPINPVKKVAPTATGLSDDLSIEEWTRRRNAQVAKRRG